MCFTSIYKDWGQCCHNPSVNNKKGALKSEKVANHWEKGSAAE